MSRKFITFLLLFASACFFQLQMVTPVPAINSTPSEIPPLLISPTSTLMLSPTPVVMNPTDVSIATKSAAGTVPTETPVDLGASRIQFDPQGTFADIVTSLSAGTSKTYVVSALKGQVMSVSMNQGLDGDWTVIPLQITGADGAALCNPIVFNNNCYFWRGVLPTSQDYSITLKPDTNVSNFTLRVAIDPPGTMSQSFQYVSPQQDARFTYQDDFAPARFPGPLVGKVDPQFALQLIDSSFYNNTNLIEAYLLFGSSNDNSLVTNCVQPVDFGGGEQVTDKVTINNRVFVRSDGAGVGAGNDYVHTAYRAVVNGACYEMIFYYHYGDIGNYDPALGIKEFDDQGLLQKFQNILSTLVIK